MAAASSKAASSKTAADAGSPFPQWVFAQTQPTWPLFDYRRFRTLPGAAQRETLYSSLMPWHHPATLEAFRAEFPEPAAVARVYDLTAHVGVDTAFFLFFFPEARVVAVELEAATARVLRRNGTEAARLFGRPPDAFRAVHGDGVAHLRALKKEAHTLTKETLIYFDPPWGGKGTDYSVAPPLGGVPLAALVREALDKGARVVVKVPPQVDAARFGAAVGRGGRPYPVRDERKPEKTSYLLIAFA